MFSRLTNFISDRFSPNPGDDPRHSNTNSNQNQNQPQVNRQQHRQHRQQQTSNNNNIDGATAVAAPSTTSDGDSFNTSFGKLFASPKNNTPKLQAGQQQHQQDQQQRLSSDNNAVTTLRKRLENEKKKNQALAQKVQDLLQQQNEAPTTARVSTVGSHHHPHSLFHTPHQNLLTRRRLRDDENHPEQIAMSIDHYHLFFINQENLKFTKNGSLTKAKPGRPKKDDGKLAGDHHKLDSGGLGKVYVAEYFIPLPHRRQQYTGTATNSVPTPKLVGKNNKTKINNKSVVDNQQQKNEVVWSKQVAVKIFHDFDNGSKEVNLFLTLMMMNNHIVNASSIHPNIVRCYGYTLFENDTQIALVLEKADSSFEAFLQLHGKNKPTQLTKSQIYDFCLQIAAGLEFLHRQDILHIDLKPDNVLCFTDEQTKQTTLKLTDFGSVKQSDLQNRFRAGSPVITTEEYAPPEQYNCQSPSPSPNRKQLLQIKQEENEDVIKFLRNITPSWDVFSFGRILNDMIRHSNLVVTKTNQDPLLDPSELKKLSSRCCRKDPQLRIKDGIELLQIVRELKEKDKM